MITRLGSHIIDIRFLSSNRPASSLPGSDLVGVDIDDTLIAKARTVAQRSPVASASRFFCLDWMHPQPSDSAQHQLDVEKAQGFDVVLA